MDSERNFIIINLLPLSNMNELFDICVDILYWIANITGWTYKEANIWIFVIIHPILTLSLMIWAMKLKIKLIKTAKYETV